MIKIVRNGNNKIIGIRKGGKFYTTKSAYNKGTSLTSATYGRRKFYTPKRIVKRRKSKGIFGLRW